MTEMEDAKGTLWPRLKGIALEKQTCWQATHQLNQTEAMKLDKCRCVEKEGTACPFQAE